MLNSSKIEENCNLQRVSKVCIRRSTDLFSSTFNFQSFKVSELIMNNLACALSRELISRVVCDKRMTSDRFYDPYISFVFSLGLYLWVYATKHKNNWIVWIKPCLNLFSDFFGNCTTCLSFYWSRPACLSKAFFLRCKHYFIVRWLNLSSAAKIILFTLPPKCKISTRRAFFFLL